jgi:hypothetical protein
VPLGEALSEGVNALETEEFAELLLAGVSDDEPLGSPEREGDGEEEDVLVLEGDVELQAESVTE